MPAKQPVAIGSITVSPEGGADDYNVDIIVRVADSVYQLFGSPTLDPAALQGTTQTGPNGEFRFPKKGSTTGRTITLITDGTLPSGRPKTYNMQLPRICPLHVLDKFLSGLTFSGDTVIAFKAQGGIRIPVGQTVVA